MTLLGHMPGWCPEIHAVGPYRAVTRVADRGPVLAHTLSAWRCGTDGVIRVRLRCRALSAAEQPACLLAGGLTATLLPDRAGWLAAELRIPDAAPWWPHTHGTPALHDVEICFGTTRMRLGRVGFRSIVAERGADGCGFRLVVNGVPVFCRGACWTSAGLTELAHDRDSYARWLHLARDAGMNMVRVGGTMTYEADAFHELCDELGILVWQDFMFANFDYPVADESFRRSVVEEATQLLDRLQHSPSLAVLCGGSEVAQQAAMLGLSAEERRSPLFEELLPALVRERRPDVPYVPGSPSGGSLPFAVDRGVAHYYGVGAYLRPLDDARRAGVRFASECLALAHLPRGDALDARAALRATVPRDLGASWDFADVRDHYLAELYAVAPMRLRAEDPERYVELSRAVSADLVELAFAEWRRPASSCGGGLVWQFQDVAAGAGWGMVEVGGRPKSAWHGARRAWAPVQVLLSDEGLNGLGVHLLNETADELDLVLTLRCLARGETAMATAHRPLRMAARGTLSLSSFELLDRFFDITRAYRFGPPEHDVTVAALAYAATGQAVSEAFHFPLGRALPAAELGLAASLEREDAGWALSLSTDRFAQAVHVEADGYVAETDWFHLPPGRTRRVALRADAGVTAPPSGIVRALNAVRPSSFRPRA